jgi:hypothetical protein
LLAITTTNTAPRVVPPHRTPVQFASEIPTAGTPRAAHLNCPNELPERTRTMFHRITRAAHHLSTHSSLHHAGIYALLLLGFLEAVSQWPLEIEIIDVFVDNPTLLEFDTFAWKLLSWSILGCSALGMMRRSWLDRIAGAIAFARGQFVCGWVLGYNEGLFIGLYDQIFYLLIEAPFSTALALADEIEGLAVPLFAVYIGLVWLVLRIAFALARRSVNEFAARKLARWNLAFLADKEATHV